MKDSSGLPLPAAWSGSSRKRSSGTRNAPCAQTTAVPRASAENAPECGERRRDGGAEEAPGGEQGEERGEREGLGEERDGEGERNDGGVVDVGGTERCAKGRGGGGRQR
jgi:hypothetical protein